jgi:tripartite-type tricarboxylate transporter receptor subunit TctC
MWRKGLKVIVTGALLIAGVMLATAEHSHAENWPVRPVRWVVPYVPAGATDLVSRTVAERLTGALGQQVVVDNRPGATGTIAFEQVARTTPDGYTLITAADTITLLPVMFPKITFDPRTSFTPVALMSTQPLVLAVHASIPVQNFKEFIAYAKAKPGTLTFGSSGTGTSQHLSGELVKKMTGIDMQHVPYKGGGQAIIALSGGQVPAAVLGSSTVIPQHKAGRVRILAVTSKKRSAALPDIPTLAEMGLTGFDVYQWTSMLAPAKTPNAIINRLHREVVEILKQPATRAKLETAGFEPQTGSPQEVAALIREGMDRWTKLVIELKLQGS